MTTLIFLLGIAVGSFLNAYIFRLHVSEDRPPDARRTVLPQSVWRGRSYCPKCKKQLSWYELIPLLSFFVQLGRCRGCKQRIDWQYPLVELVTGILFMLAYFQLPAYLLTSVPTYLITCYLLAVLVVLFVYDLRYGLVPDKVVLPAIVVAIIFHVLQIMRNANGHYVLLTTYYLLAIAIGAGFFALQYYLSRGRWLGAGDIRLGALMGAMVGWPFIIEALVISYLIGGAFAGILLILGKKRFGQTLPLGTFLTLGTAVVFLYGEQIWRAYWR